MDVCFRGKSGRAADITGRPSLTPTGHRRPAFAERKVMEYIDPTADRSHSALMLAARITLPHFSVSSAMSLPKSAGESTSGALPRLANRALILGSARPVLISC
jgi:hypothetical protein